MGNGLGSFNTKSDIISPSLTEGGGGDALLLHLGRIAIFPSTRKELTQVFELGYKNGETWIHQESERQKHYDKIQRRKKKTYNNNTEHNDTVIAIVTVIYNYHNNIIWFCKQYYYSSLMYTFFFSTTHRGIRHHYFYCLVVSIQMDYRKP